MSRRLLLVLGAVMAVTTAVSVYSNPAQRSTLRGQEAAVSLGEKDADALVAAVDKQSLARAAYDFSGTLSTTDEARRILAFTQAFNLATEASLPEALALRVEPLMKLQPDPESIFADPTFQENFEAVVSDPSRVLGGAPTTEHPECVAVGGPTGWCCTGTLVAPDRVVTAGHCFETCATRVFVGASITEPGEIIPVREATRHPGYASQNHNDLTVLTLQYPVQGVSPATLATPEAIADAEFVRVVGYGTTNAWGTAGYGKRRMVDVPIASTNCRPDTVGDKYGCDGGLEIVAGAPFLDRDSCNGDSGGPAYVEAGGRWLLAGATSRATKNSLRPCGDGGIYVRVPEYSDWILQ